jgi:uncharacterized membrane protein HdeD (DUF308 family)
MSVSLFPYLGHTAEKCLLILALLSTPLSLAGIALSVLAFRKGERNVAKWGLVLGVIGVILTYPAFGYVVLKFW